MAKEYVFRYPGSKDAFLQKLDSVCESYCGTKYLGDYMIKLADNEIRFGVERAGHSGGYWYVSPLEEVDGRLEFRGKIRYIGPPDDRNKLQKLLDLLLEMLIVVLFWPVAMLADVVCLIVRKIRRQPSPPTQEQKLIELMNRLGCIQVQSDKEQKNRN